MINSFIFQYLNSSVILLFRNVWLFRDWLKIYALRGNFLCQFMDEFILNFCQNLCSVSQCLFTLGSKKCDPKMKNLADCKHQLLV